MGHWCATSLCLANLSSGMGAAAGEQRTTASGWPQHCQQWLTNCKTMRSKSLISPCRQSPTTPAASTGLAACSHEKKRCTCTAVFVNAMTPKPPYRSAEKPMVHVSYVPVALRLCCREMRPCNQCAACHRCLHQERPPCTHRQYYAAGTRKHL